MYNCVFWNNNGQQTGSDQSGGSVFSFQVDTKISNCLVVENSASNGGGMGSLGTSSALLLFCYVNFNQGSTIVYENSVFSGNKAAGGGAGGAISFDGTKVSFTLCGITARKNEIHSRGVIFRVGEEQITKEFRQSDCFVYRL